jgi:hypothetical protein
MTKENEMTNKETRPGLIREVIDKNKALPEAGTAPVIEPARRFP